MWWLLIPLALWLSTVGVSGTELTGVQRRGLQVALEEFHKHPPVQWVFQETSVDNVTDTVSGMNSGGGGPPAQPPTGLCWFTV
jgi:retinoic acid receptor responder protein 2